MAEFQEVIKQMKRMCAHFSPTCNGCKLYLGEGTDEFCGEEPKDILSNPALVEAAVMQWAAEHPEPVYPTWWEYLTRIHVIFPAMGDFQKCVDDLATTPIPADIAQKLGIEPSVCIRA